jgi:SAM-dependent methyltransferase
MVASDSFDVVWNIGVIEHFYDSGKKLLITEMLRLAKPGGKIIILVPNFWCWQFQLVQAWQKYRGTWPYGFEDEMNPTRLARLCAGMGLSNQIEALYAYDPIEGWYRFPKISRIVSFVFDNLENHLKLSRMGFMSVLVLRK